MDHDRRTQLVASIGSLAGIAIPVFAFRAGVNQVWLWLPCGVALAAGWYTYRNGHRAERIQLKGELELLVDILNLLPDTGARITYHAKCGDTGEACG
jgi:hypothetical protein